MLLLLAAVIAMLALNRPRADAVAILLLVTLPFTGLVSVQESLSGFADPSVVLVAALFVIGDGLVRTGVASRIGDWIGARGGQGDARVIVLLMLVTAGLGSMMSSTGVVAIFIPVALRVAARRGIQPGRLMMPLSVAALVSGMLTLVATPPNLVVNAELVRAGLPLLGFFSFTPIGLTVLILAIGWMLLARRWLGESARAEQRPAGRRLADLAADYAVLDRVMGVRLRPDSPLLHKPLSELDLRARYGLDVLAIDRRKGLSHRTLQPEATTQLYAGDLLEIYLSAPAEEGRLPPLLATLRMEAVPLDLADAAQRPRQIGVAEVMIAPESKLIGETITEARFRSRTGLTVVGLRHGAAPSGRKALTRGLTEQALEVGDTLLVVGPWRSIRRLRERRDLVILHLPPELEEETPEMRHAPQALLATALVVLLMVTGAVPHVVAALIGCLVMGATGCTDLDSAYRAISWRTVVLIAGMLPLSLALQRAGGVDLAVAGLQSVMHGLGPRGILACLFAVTAIMGMFLSNTATAVLMAPVGIATAQELGLAAQPFAMTVALAASTAFMTPVSSPVNMLVIGPGGYRFADFLRIGVPLALASMVVTVVMVPWILPLH
ncbi:SLC13 family permease [Roseomonas xinghualingensis]|uniref:SLC13 family permease n=1 Tax=Roseomonas xinghualingensis TaxID=2986475 RepID=UPI0021F19C06|nr:SLC13 family permease [Roseomonas sp. SXEYE001]MCV4209474.1 SLC13 family permease [Roseomonas sp. SXEYE001]